MGSAEISKSGAPLPYFYSLKYLSKNIQYFVLLWLFVHPTAIQFLHHHNDAGVYQTNGDNTLELQHSKCALCDFHFPIFSNKLHSIHIQKCTFTFEQFVIHYAETPSSSVLYVASLRGPPLRENHSTLG